MAQARRESAASAEAIRIRRTRSLSCRVLSQIPESRRGLFLARSYMGFRASEARRLNVADLKLGPEGDLGDAFIDLHPRSSKMRQGRKLELHPEVAVWLAPFGELQRIGLKPLFRNRRATNDEKRWTETSEKRTLTRAMSLSKVEHIKPNEMGRHFFATQAVNRGAGIYDVQDWLGRSDPRPPSVMRSSARSQSLESFDPRVEGTWTVLLIRPGKA